RAPRRRPGRPGPPGGRRAGDRRAAARRGRRALGQPRARGRVDRRRRMSPATWPRDDRGATRLLLIDRDSGARRDATARDLPRVLRPGDLLVVNDAATLPASLRARLDGPSDMSEETGDFEVRLTGIGDATWRAVLL